MARDISVLTRIKYYNINNGGNKNYDRRNRNRNQRSYG